MLCRTPLEGFSGDRETVANKLYRPLQRHPREGIRTHRQHRVQRVRTHVYLSKGSARSPAGRCRWWMDLPHEEGCGGRKKRRELGKAGKESLSIVMSIALDGARATLGTVGATQLAATHWSAAGKHLYYHRKMLSRKLVARCSWLSSHFSMSGLQTDRQIVGQARQQQDRNRNSGTAGIDTGTPGSNSIGGDEATPDTVV